MADHFPESLSFLEVNDEAVRHAKDLIKQGKVNCNDPWSTEEPTPSSQYYFLKDHTMEEYGCWFLAIKRGVDEINKDRYKFPIGDFHTIYRQGVITAKSYASKYKFKPLEEAADELLELIDEQCK